MRLKVGNKVGILEMAIKKGPAKNAEPFDIIVVGDARLERATSGSGDQRSIQLS